MPEVFGRAITAPDDAGEGAARPDPPSGVAAAFAISVEFPVGTPPETGDRLYIVPSICEQADSVNTNK